MPINWHAGDAVGASHYIQHGGVHEADLWSCTFLLQGKLYVRGDSKIFRFQNGKSESLFLQRKNPRRIAWTVLYRRAHRKGISEV